MIKFEIANIYIGTDAAFYYGKYLSDKTRPDYRLISSVDVSLDIFVLPHDTADVLLAYKSKRYKQFKNGLYRVVILKEKKKQTRLQ